MQVLNASLIGVVVFKVLLDELIFKYLGLICSYDRY